MRPLSRLRPSIEAVLSANTQSHQFPYVCRSCRTVAPRRHASITSWFSKKKTEDPKSDNTAVGPRIVENDDNFVPASTWDGLEWIGGQKWEKKRNVVEGHKFERYKRQRSSALLFWHG